MFPSFAAAVFSGITSGVNLCSLQVSRRTWCSQAAQACCHFERVSPVGSPSPLWVSASALCSVFPPAALLIAGCKSKESIT